MKDSTKNLIPPLIAIAIGSAIAILFIKFLLPWLAMRSSLDPLS